MLIKEFLLTGQSKLAITMWGGDDMPLAMLKQDGFGMIREIYGKSAVVKRLEDLGFVAGETVRVITELSGNMIIELKGSRLALDRAMANHIILRD